MTPEQLRRIYEENVRRRQRLVMASFLMNSSAGTGAPPVVSPFVGAPDYSAQSTLADRGPTGGGALLVQYPTGIAANDIAFIEVISISAVGTAHTISTPAGWSLVSEQQISTFAFNRHAVFWKRLTGAETGTVEIDLSIADPSTTHTWYGEMSSWRGAKSSGVPFEAVGNSTGNSVNMAGTQVITTGTDRTILNFCAKIGATLSSPAALWTENYDLTSTFGTDDGSLKNYSLKQPTAATVPAATHVLAASGHWHVVSLALIGESGTMPTANLITNGTFDTNTTGWTLGGGTGTITATAGKGVVASSDTFVVFSMPIATTIGATYNTWADVADGVDSAFWAVRKSDDAASTTNLVNLTSGNGLAQASSFVATATTTFIILQVNNAGGTAKFDNISVIAA